MTGQVCGCHGEPAYWSVDKSMLAGGHWRCAVKDREYHRRRYDADPVHRIEKNLHDRARRRRETIERRRASLVTDLGGDSHR